MAKQRTSKSENTSNQSPSRPKNKYLLVTIYFVLALFFIMASVNKAGTIGNFIHHKIVVDILGYGFFVIPLLLLTFAHRTYKDQRVHLKDKIGMGGFVISLVGLLQIFIHNEIAGGGIGSIVQRILISGFDVYFSAILLFGIFFISTLVVFDPHMTLWKSLIDSIKNWFTRRSTERVADDKIERTIKKNIDEEEDEDSDEDEEEDEQPKKEKSFSIAGITKRKKERDDDIVMDNLSGIFTSSYITPPLELLGKSSGKPSTGDIKANANIIERTFANFGIAVEMDEISIGPTVTRYAMKPAQGVRLSRIASLQNELALALAAKSIRIEAPIPGRSLVGIEVPNTTKSKIGLGTLLADSEFQKSDKPLLVSLGKGVSGDSYYTDIGKMPHALVAGATGSGKSVTVHNIILSLLYRNGPDMLRFIMVDPKRVEMTLYKKIPHLLTPVITDPKKAVLALKWAVKEMERRYNVLQSCVVRDIDSYHKTIVAPAYKGLSEEDMENRSGELPEKMPYIVVIIDELSDIMSSYPRELEASIVRLAQMSRAVGIHLLLSTQRPSVNVITGLIKANIPTRIALKVASQIDSRTILDAQGAEKLLGRGDMLYKGEGSNEPVRIQCPFVSEEEVKKVVHFIKKNYQFELEDEINLPDEQIDGGGGFSLGSDGDDEDPMYEEARAIVISSQKASTSYLQRRLSIGYSRAARIIDILEERGVVGPANGSKPREVLEQASDQASPDETEFDNGAFE